MLAFLTNQIALCRASTAPCHPTSGHLARILPRKYRQKVLVSCVPVNRAWACCGHRAPSVCVTCTETGMLLPHGSPRVRRGKNDMWRSCCATSASVSRRRIDSVHLVKPRPPRSLRAVCRQLRHRRSLEAVRELNRSRPRTMWGGCGCEMWRLRDATSSWPFLSWSRSDRGVADGSTIVDRFPSQRVRRAL